ncbi:MAG: hypothetical protein JXR96_08110, partial [Deltaproteobacteria bacterium]|nr:hypothetical protein [Deltaproteobacteria bacterium]
FDVLRRSEPLSRLPLILCLGVVILGCDETIVGMDDAARGCIAASGVHLPPTATELYYAFQPQFADYLDTWISFSASSTDCMSAARSLARLERDEPVFVAGTRSRSDAVTGGPAYHHPELATPRWDLSGVTNGKLFETKDLFVLVDTDRSRVYIALRSPQRSGW